MPKVTFRAAVLAAVLALTLTGCAAGVEEPSTAPQSTDTSTPAAETPEPKAEKMTAPAEIPAHITEPGEVCDPSNMNDAICAAFYPDQVVLNVTGRSADLAGLSDAEKIESAQRACIDGGNASLVTAGQLAYCNEQLDQRLSLTIAYYQSLGEDGAKADFADKTMPTAEEIGL